MIVGMSATALILGSLFLILFFAERLIPLRQSRVALARRLVVNLSISALALGTAAALMMPFRHQRDYWRRPDGTTADRIPMEAEVPLSHMPN